MRTVALYGFATLTREGIWQSKADEIWSVIWAYKYKVPRLDRLLEIHPIWLQARSKKPEYKKARDHWKWLKHNRTIPIYMLVQHPSVPMAVRYPIEAVQDLVPPARRKAVFTSSFDYLVSMAIVEGFERIEPYGFDMGSDTEYRYQREGAAYWIGYCDAHGIELVLPSNTRLLSKKLYGYEGGSMIYRQDLERMKGVREQQKVEAFARLNGIEGRLNKAVQDEQQGTDYFRQLQDEWNEQYKMALIITGALQECEYYLKEIDLEEPELELENPTNFIKA